MLRKKLARWYKDNARDLPWRRSRDPYAIWVSEIMLQQTRVVAAIPYYERFLARFPDAQSLASASETEVLTAWSGLGYYTRARNLRKAAQRIAALGAFPSDYESIRGLPGVGDYTAAAVASIAFGLPHAVVDGNVRRVITRLTGDSKADVEGVANRLLDRKHPARSNQALMELGALVCLPRDPACGRCPLGEHCEARRQGTQAELPVKKPRPTPERIRVTLLVIRRGGKILLRPSPRVRGFWELPEPFSGAREGIELGSFRHSIMNSQYECEVREAIADNGRAKGRTLVERNALARNPTQHRSKKGAAT